MRIRIRKGLQTEGGNYKEVRRGRLKPSGQDLLEENGNARTRVLPEVRAKTLQKNIVENVDKSNTIHTDELKMYINIGKQFEGGQKSVNHSAGQYTGLGTMGTNTAESYFSLLKRGVYGNFHHVSKKHLFRCCVEFDFRWNSRDMEFEGKTIELLCQVSGKRLMYKAAAANTGIQENTSKKAKARKVADLKMNSDGMADIRMQVPTN